MGMRHCTYRLCHSGQHYKGTRIPFVKDNCLYQAAGSYYLLSRVDTIIPIVYVILDNITRGHAYYLARTTACIKLQDPTTWTVKLPVSSCRIILLDRAFACIQLQDPTTWTVQLPVSSCRILLLDRATASIHLQDPTSWTVQLPVSSCRILLLDRATASIQLQDPTTWTG
jgi:hypothetical protein